MKQFLSQIESTLVQKSMKFYNTKQTFHIYQSKKGDAFIVLSNLINPRNRLF